MGPITCTLSIVSLWILGFPPSALIMLSLLAVFPNTCLYSMMVRAPPKPSCPPLHTFPPTYIFIPCPGKFNSLALGVCQFWITGIVLYMAMLFLATFIRCLLMFLINKEHYVLWFAFTAFCTILLCSN